MLTVDLVITGDSSAARAAAISALQNGQRVLVVSRSADERVARRFRRGVRNAVGAASDQLRVIGNADVVCVDGVDAVETVVVRHARTGLLSAVNASVFVSFDDASQ